MNRYTSETMLQSKMREIERKENESAKLQSDQANLTSEVAKKTAKLHRYQQELYKEQGREQSKLLDNLERKRNESEQQQKLLLKQLSASTSQPTGTAVTQPVNSREPKYDAFISHATEDKEELVRPLAEALHQKGHSIWFDEFQLKVGDSLRRSIDKGLVQSRFGIVVLSPAFFAKSWPQYELDGLVEKEMSGGKVILPLWHKVSKDEVMKYSPPLADKVSLNTAQYSIDELAELLSEAIRDV